MAAAQVSGWNCHCPLKRKGHTSLGKCASHEEAVERVLWHLEHSAKQYLDNGDAAEVLDKNPECIWEEEMQESQFEKRRERSRSPARSSCDGPGKGKRDDGSTSTKGGKQKGS